MATGRSPDGPAAKLMARVQGTQSDGLWSSFGWTLRGLSIRTCARANLLRSGSDVFDRLFSPPAGAIYMARASFELGVRTSDNRARVDADEF